jgi:hypothetical protein
MSEHKVLTWIFPKASTEQVQLIREVLTNRKSDDDIFIGNCEEVTIIDFEKQIMYIVEKGNPRIIRVEEMEGD